MGRRMDGGVEGCEDGEKVGDGDGDGSCGFVGRESAHRITREGFEYMILTHDLYTCKKFVIPFPTRTHAQRERERDKYPPHRHHPPTRKRPHLPSISPPQTLPPSPLLNPPTQSNITLPLHKFFPLQTNYQPSTTPINRPTTLITKMLLNFLLLTFLLTTPTLACKCFHQPDHSTGWDLRNTVGCCRYV